jgi:hydrogenase maturation protein HypF
MERRRILVNGIVQGVGFRPYIYNLARSENLAGQVSNSSAGVTIEIQGSLKQIESFLGRLPVEAPPLSRIITISTEAMALVASHENTGNAPEFSIVISENTPGTSTLIPPDMATCSDCLHDISDPDNRRFGYPFTNCTNCGPRWTIIKRIPYDRPFTSMARFTMCALCQSEYQDPGDRRFHAQPNACPECGPRLWLENAGGKMESSSGPLAEAAGLLLAGNILAIKGLGGFHLAVRGDDEAAVVRLRLRKNREAKPLAVMAASTDRACDLVGSVSQEEKALLESPQAPIVLVEYATDAVQNSGRIAPSVAPGHARLGVMLPYTPLHHLLMAELGERGVHALVLTSGNASDEPICLDNDEAKTKLADIADYWLLHDRDIVRRADDSVLQAGIRAPLFFRRSRGYAPVPLFMGDDFKEGSTILAVGPEMKNTVALLEDDRAFLSPHIGDLENLKAFEFFKETIATMEDIIECEPDVVAHDMHPGYFSTQWVQGNSFMEKTIVPVQHHHAHMAAVMAEHGLHGDTLGVVMDGTGYGTDGTIWGGEILSGDYSDFCREAHLQPVPLPGGEAAIRAPWKIAASYLRHTLGHDQSQWPELSIFKDQPLSLVLEMLDKNINSPLTSSCGRLFDAVAALTGQWGVVHYEAQAAIEFMAQTSAAAVEVSPGLPGLNSETCLKDGVIQIGPFISGVLSCLEDRRNTAQISAAFHRSLIDVLDHCVASVSEKTGITQVVLGGGVFQNDILLEGLLLALSARPLKVFTPCALPPNDGAIAMGQAAVARAQTKHW